MAQSKALSNFKDLLELPAALLQIEGTYYHNPPRSSETKFVQGLRGGSVVLMVGAFESFLRDLFEEHLSCLVGQPAPVQFDKLPDKIREHTVFETLNRAMKGPPFANAGPRIDRLPEIDQACRLVISGFINPSAFSDTYSNPGPGTVQSMFKSVGVQDVFSLIKKRFESRSAWGQQVSATFIRDKLDEIVQRRNRVAHGLDVLNISKKQVKDDLRYLKKLGEVLDFHLQKHVEDICRTARP